MYFVQGSLQENSCSVRDVKLLLPYIFRQGLVPEEVVQAFHAEGSLNSSYISPPIGRGTKSPLLHTALRELSGSGKILNLISRLQYFISYHHSVIRLIQTVKGIYLFHK